MQMHVAGLGHVMQHNAWHVCTETLGGLDWGWTQLRDGSKAEAEQVITVPMNFLFTTDATYGGGITNLVGRQASVWYTWTWVLGISGL